MDGDKYSKIYSEKEAVLEDHLRNLEKIIYECRVPLEGNAFYHHQSPGRWNEGDKLVRHDKFINKQINLFWEHLWDNLNSCLLQLLVLRPLWKIKFQIRKVKEK